MLCSCVVCHESCIIGWLLSREIPSADCFVLLCYHNSSERKAVGTVWNSGQSIFKANTMQLYLAIFYLRLRFNNEQDELRLQSHPVLCSDATGKNVFRRNFEKNRKGNWICVRSIFQDINMQGLCRMHWNSWIFTPITMSVKFVCFLPYPSSG